MPPTDPATAREAADTTGTFSGGLTSVGVYLDEAPTMPRRNRRRAVERPGVDRNEPAESYRNWRSATRPDREGAFDEYLAAHAAGGYLRGRADADGLTRPASRRRAELLGRVV